MSSVISVIASLSRCPVRLLVCLTFLVCARTAAAADASAGKPFVVVIDAGHGGKDTGATGEYGREKDINLAVALKAGEMISEAFDKDEVKVVYTRSKDVFVPLQNRCDIANRAGGDLFISVHVNSVDAKSPRRNTVEGASVYTLGLGRSKENLEVAKRENSVMTLEPDYSTRYQGFDPNSAESYIMFEMTANHHMDRSIRFASMVQKELVGTAGRVDKGVRQDIFWVLVHTGMPAVLIELDFICNPRSEEFLTSKKGTRRLAEAITNAFTDYHAMVTKSAAKTP
ncbi:MAG: N-acetylmuramoyl-L-alanine amidase [Candidatus Amulumruptor caecigallinarius]|nr:N-acetylmuramoyl-L-alanine amidase [Candidatus Amulumruptor caecigallinarius]MCM1396137.1 N-acetylmuramoyl-L-alanine amidase [Candidatus Amulumruptor caecigallinarius]MCM1453863.1 N-acetylmuramoyl-L-alanine amidase [bacterium]